MDTSHLKDLKKKLLEEKITIGTQLQRIAKKNPAIEGDWTAVPPDIDDPSTTMDERAQSVTELEERRAVEQSLELRLKEIDKALQQIDAGSYGQCINCKSPINAKRLIAMPVVASCIDCANKKTTFL